jgi:4'-phosphopantetheinyl transferase
MRLPPARYAFVKTRLALRRILGDYLSVAPQDLRFCYGAQGKPALDYPASAIRFNLSHTGDQCLLALSRDTELGIDIEASKPRKQLLRIAERLFSANQYAHLQSLSEPARSQVFFYYWTRLEARIKAQGSGLFEPAKTPSDTFSCRSFIPAPDHLASLATQTACPPIAHWRTYLYREA